MEGKRTSSDARTRSGSSIWGDSDLAVGCLRRAGLDMLGDIWEVGSGRFLGSKREVESRDARPHSASDKLRQRKLPQSVLSNDTTL